MLATNLRLLGYKLPKDFVWGVAGSAWQIEGGLKEEGRGVSSLDSVGAIPNPDGTNDANAANMNYYLYKQDIVRLAAIGMPYYSFSIAWTRIVPFGYEDSPINQPGLEHYDDLINTCIEHGITPIVTLVHADAPINANYNSTDFPDAFMYYAKQVVSRYGDRVSHWVTFNEANIDCVSHCGRRSFVMLTMLYSLLARLDRLPSRGAEYPTCTLTFLPLVQGRAKGHRNSEPEVR